MARSAPCGPKQSLLKLLYTVPYSDRCLIGVTFTTAQGGPFLGPVWQFIQRRWKEDSVWGSDFSVPRNGNRNNTDPRMTSPETARRFCKGEMGKNQSSKPKASAADQAANVLRHYPSVCLFHLKLLIFARY